MNAARTAHRRFPLTIRDEIAIGWDARATTGQGSWGSPKGPMDWAALRALGADLADFAGAPGFPAAAAGELHWETGMTDTELAGLLDELLESRGMAPMDRLAFVAGLTTDRPMGIPA